MSDISLAAFSLGLLCSGCLPASAASLAGQPPGFVRLQEVAPDIVQDMRYAGSNNFTGRPVPGYAAPRCWLRKEVAQALARVQKEAAAEGLTLVVYDCYRPQRATKAFAAWAADEADQAMKPAYYPHVEKRALFELGYISKTSAHSTGTAVDLGFANRDFGTPFDLFDEASATLYAGISDEAKANRAKLLALMEKHGFENLPNEWWHFSLKGVKDATPQDFEVR